MVQRTLLIGALLAVPLGASAQGVIDVQPKQGDDAARAHFDVGRSLYDAGRFDEAAEEWEKAFALSGRHELLYNVYVAYRDASNGPKAMDALERYLRSDVVPQEQRINLQARLDALRTGQQETTAAPPVAAEPASTEPAPTEPTSETASLAVEPGGESDIVPYVLLGVGGALVAGGVVTGILARSKVSDIEAACPNDLCPSAFPLEDERSSARGLATVTDVLLVGGVVIAGVGAVLWLTGGDGETESGTPTAALGCMPGGCMAAISGSL